MAFEFFFGWFGLISDDSKSRHKARLASEWQMPRDVLTNLFDESGHKSPLDDTKEQIFSMTGNKNGTAMNLSDGLFSSKSSSSASSIASSGSNVTINSTSAFIKQPASEQNKKYEFRLNLRGDKNASDSSSASTGIGTDSSNSTCSGMGAANLRFATSGSSTRKILLNDDDNLELNSKLIEESNQINSGASSPDLLREPTPSGQLEISRKQKLRRIYCAAVSTFLWIAVFRVILGFLFERTILTLEYHALGLYKIHYLIPKLCVAIQAAAVSTLFIRNNDETNWLVPFYSSKDYLIRTRSNFKPKMEDYTRRVNISVGMALVLALVSAVSQSVYLYHCASEYQYGSTTPTAATAAGAAAAAAATLIANRQQTYATQYETVATATSTSTTTTMAPTTYLSTSSIESPVNSSALLDGSADSSASSGDRIERTAMAFSLIFDVIWAFYSTYICFLVSFYFNLICAIMKSRFHGISKVIEDLAESNTTKTTNQARKITTLYLEHNEACELLDESNDFWQYLIFFTYFTYIPAYCYCLYNLFFVDFEAWPSFITWVIHTHTGFIILLISFSAAGVSTEAHAPYTSLHTLSLIQLPLDVEVNIATFLHRVRGLTIGYSCYDLFAITNASMSNTAAACASYFLIVADFSRSSVFTMAQMNATKAGATPTQAAAAAVHAD